MHVIQWLFLQYWLCSSYLIQTLPGTALSHFCCQPKLWECPLSAEPCEAEFVAQMPSRSSLGLWLSRQSGMRPRPACSGRGAIHFPPNETIRSSVSSVTPGNEASVCKKNTMCVLKYPCWQEEGRKSLPTPQKYWSSMPIRCLVAVKIASLSTIYAKKFLLFNIFYSLIW